MNRVLVLPVLVAVLTAGAAQAQPFPNPPHQLVERSGLINFGLGFLLDLNGATKMRWFRYND